MRDGWILGGNPAWRALFPGLGGGTPEHLRDLLHPTELELTLEWIDAVQQGAGALGRRPVRLRVGSERYVSGWLSIEGGSDPEEPAALVLFEPARNAERFAYGWVARIDVAAPEVDELVGAVSSGRAPAPERLAALLAGLRDLVHDSVDAPEGVDLDATIAEALEGPLAVRGGPVFRAPGATALARGPAATVRHLVRGLLQDAFERASSTGAAVRVTTRVVDEHVVVELVSGPVRAGLAPTTIAMVRRLEGDFAVQTDSAHTRVRVRIPRATPVG